MASPFSRLPVVLLYAALATGCAAWLPAPAPIRVMTDRVDHERRSRCLLVLLPGFGDSEKDFAEHGFIAALRARNLAVDVVAANATLGYYARRTLYARIRDDILAPARAAGYRDIWLGGISMGGLGALLVAKSEGRDISGIVLLAPYLGDEDLLKEIEAAGGVARWQPGEDNPKEDYARALWRWLKRSTEAPQEATSIYLGAGDKDRLSRGHRLLASALPRERTYRTPGGHDWGPWSHLWADFLDHSDFRARCSSPE